MPVASPGAPPGRVFYGRTVVTAAGLVLFMAYGTQYAFGVFFAALVEEFGWSRASVSGVFSLYAAVYSGFALMAGRLTDRWGPRTVIAIGGALLGAGLVAMSRVGVLWPALPALRHDRRARHVHRPRAVQRHRGEVVHASAGARGGAGQRGRQPRHVRAAPGGQAGAFAGFAQSHALPALYASSLVFGFAYGAASTLFPAIVADVFGREQAGTLAGPLFALAGSMVALGPLIAGFIYDRAGDYQLAWWLSAGCNGLALLLLASFPLPLARTANEHAVA
jgi:MFS family permease